MTNKQESRYSMELALRDFLNKNPTVIATIPNFITLFTLFTANIIQIQIIREQQEVNKSGIKDNKDLLRGDLVAKAYDVGRKTEVYAKMTNNAILAKEVHYSETELMKSADSRLKDKCLLIYNRANSNVAALATYGVNAALLTSLKSAIDLFNTAIPSTRTGVTETKQATDQLTKLFDMNYELIAKFDMLVDIVRTTQPVFYSSYKDNRKIVNTGTGSLALKISARNFHTQDPEANVTLTLTPSNMMLKSVSMNERQSIVKRTADGGGSHFKGLSDGVYTLVAKKTGYNDVVETVNIVNGEMAFLEIKMEMN